MQTNRGFTLIELLVVIAIIGILAGMVVVNINTAPTSAKNAKIQSYFDQMRTAAVAWQASNSPTTYVGFNGSGDGKILEDKIKEISGTSNYNVTTSENVFCAKALLVGSTSTYWCIDSANGYSGTTSASGCTSTASNWDCL